MSKVIPPGPSVAADEPDGQGGDQPGFGLGAAPDAASGPPPGDRGLGEAPVVSGFGEAAAVRGLGEAAKPPAQVRWAEEPVPEGYQTRVDADGDGEWDPHTLHAGEDGGVDILVDSTGDGQIDFVGHDDAADGRVDWAEYDTNGDGVADIRTYDDTGDGWMDRTDPVTP